MALDPLSQRTIDLLQGVNTSKQALITKLNENGAGVPDGAKLADLPPYVDNLSGNVLERMAKESHGSSTLLKGTWDCGYFGSFAAADMGTFDDGAAAGETVTATSLAKATGVTEGTAFNEAITFDKFAYKNEIILISRKPIRHTISWKELALNNCVFGGKIVTIGGVKYKMTLLRGSNAEITDGARFDKDSEWGKLLIPLLSGQTNGWGTNLSASDLNFANSGNGVYNWCQETTGVSSSQNYRLRIYGSGGSSADYHSVGDADRYCGWRPALRFTF